MGHRVTALAVDQRAAGITPQKCRVALGGRRAYEAFSGSGRSVVGHSSSVALPLGVPLIRMMGIKHRQNTSTMMMAARLTRPFSKSMARGTLANPPGEATKKLGPERLGLPAF